jgi:hypothetical protein
MTPMDHSAHPHGLLSSLNQRPNRRLQDQAPSSAGASARHHRGLPLLSFHPQCHISVPSPNWYLCPAPMTSPPTPGSPLLRALVVPASKPCPTPSLLSPPALSSSRSPPPPQLSSPRPPTSSHFGAKGLDLRVTAPRSLPRHPTSWSVLYLLSYASHGAWLGAGSGKVGGWSHSDPL